MYYIQNATLNTVVVKSDGKIEICIQIFPFKYYKKCVKIFFFLSLSVIMKRNVPNCVDIIFDQAVIQFKNVFLKFSFFLPLSGNHLLRLTALTWKAGSRRWPCAQPCVCTRAAGGSGEVCYECDTGPGSCQLCSFQRSHQWQWGGSPPAPRRQAVKARWWPAGPGSIRSTSERSSPHSRWRKGGLNESERVIEKNKENNGEWAKCQLQLLMKTL